MTSVGGTAWRCAVRARVRVVQRVLARHERRAEQLGGRAAAGDGGDEFAERRGVTRVAPREVVEQRDQVGVGADGDDVADRLVDGDGGHRLGVVQPVPRVDADADGDAVVVLGMGQDDAVGVADVVLARQRAHQRRAADLVVVAVDDRGLGGDVRVGEQGEQRGRGIVDVPAGRSRGGVGAMAVIDRCGRPSWRNVGSRSSTGGAAGAHDEAAVAGELADVGVVDTVALAASRSSSTASGATASTMRSWASDSQISHGSQARVLERHGVELDVGADALGHLADRRRQPPAPQSVIAVHRCSAPSSTSISSFSVTGSPIWTLAPATSPVVASIAALENVAPRMPSRPVAPPSTTTRSPGNGPVGGSRSAAVPMQPQNTSGLAVNSGS